MRRFLSSIFLVGCSAAWMQAATTPLYIINSPVISPPDTAPVIDATAVWCRSTFQLDNIGFSLPYQMLNNRFFTNDPSGVMSGTLGFRFDYFNNNNVRAPMTYWTNKGSISGGSFMLVAATNIASTGPLAAGPAGRVTLEGNNINLSRTGIRAGNPPGVFFSDGFTINLTNYVNDTGVEDLWWGLGTNNRMSGPMPPMALTSFQLPNPSTPLHHVVRRFVTQNFTNLTILPQFNFKFDAFNAFVFTNTLSPTSKIVQVVFAPTNNVDTNFQTRVHFLPSFLGSGAADVVVEFTSSEFDIVDSVISSNSVFLLDTTATETNYVLHRNLTRTFPRTATGTRRPSTLQVTRGSPFFFFPGSGTSGNTPWTNTLISNPNYLSNTVTMRYVAYAATVTGVTNVPLGGPVVGDPTNFPGRIEIFGDKVSMDTVRLKAESTISIKAKNLVSNRVARVDAPYLNFDLATTQPTLVISNLAPTSIHRIGGTVAAWAGVWQNTEVTPEGTNQIQFHVLFVDNNLASQQPVIVNEFALKATNIVVQDPISTRKFLVLDGRSLTVNGGLTFPFSADWSDTNVINLRHFTNNGFISLFGSAFYGQQQDPNRPVPVPYTNFVNRGTNTASGQFVRTRFFDNPGALNSTPGAMSIDAVTAQLHGAPFVVLTNVFSFLTFDPVTFMLVTNMSTNLFTNSIGAVLSSAATLEVFANDLTTSNAVIGAGQGGLIFTVTNRFTDAGTNAISRWFTSGGFEMRRRPATSDLLGTYVTSVVSNQLQSFHTWFGLDRSTNVSGFSNNLALGKLTLDGGILSLFNFSSPDGAPRALYVDYLELLDTATNINTAFSIDPNFTIYFANANLAVDKIDDGSPESRFKWVAEFAGPLSFTNITYSSGSNYTFNIALVTSKDIDSDGDGIVNADDPEPILVPETVAMRLSLENRPPLTAVLNWYGPSNSTSVVEYKSPSLTNAWSLLSNVVNRANGTTMRLEDRVPATGGRFYRVRVDQGR